MRAIHLVPSVSPAAGGLGTGPLATARAHEPTTARITTLGDEKRVNAFLRLQNPQIVARLREKFPEIGEKPDARTV